MQITITDILQAELTTRLKRYRSLVDSGEMDRDTANHRYLCIQTALWMAGGSDKPATVTTEDDTRAEIQRWIRTIQRDTTVATMHADGRVVELLTQFLETTKPVAPVPVQTSLL